MKLAYAILLAMCLGGTAVMAQYQQEHSFFQTTSAFDRAQLKAVVQAVNDLDPTADVSASDDMIVIQVKANPSVNEGQLRAAITATGISLLAGTPDLKALYGEPPAIPMYGDTGDPLNDHKRYQEAVDAWNLAHPHEQMPQPIPYHP